MSVAPIARVYQHMAYAFMIFDISKKKNKKKIEQHFFNK